MTALYLHIPFCLSKCYYCSFNSCAAGQKLHRGYIEALKEELCRLRATVDLPPLSSLFVGGGTPTCLPSDLLTSTIEYTTRLFGKQPGAEISVEANPGTVDEHYLGALLSAGVNRLSLGVQSFDDLELQTIGRIHSGREAGFALQAAADAGFTNISLDLMYGLPGQDQGSWRRSLEKALSFHPQHLSIYQLTIETGTVFGRLVKENKIHLPAEEIILDIDDITEKFCQSSELNQYEVSNYSLAGYECRHNINYWLNNDYLAAGASAVSCLQGMRERRIADPETYIKEISRGKTVIMEQECLAREDSFRETVIMGLRMVRGVSLERLRDRYNIELVDYYGPTLTRLITAGFVELNENHLRLTGKGWPLSNQIMAQLV